MVSREHFCNVKNVLRYKNGSRTLPCGCLRVANSFAWKLETRFSHESARLGASFTLIVLVAFVSMGQFRSPLLRTSGLFCIGNFYTDNGCWSCAAILSTRPSARLCGMVTSIYVGEILQSCHFATTTFRRWKSGIPQCYGALCPPIRFFFSISETPPLNATKRCCSVLIFR